MFNTLNKINVTIATLASTNHCNSIKSGIDAKIAGLRTDAALERGKVIGLSALIGAGIAGVVSFFFRSVGK